MKKTKIFLTLVLSMLLVAAFALPVSAGNGDGSGGGKDDPLRLESSSPQDGTGNVALDAEIKLVFNKNVVHMSVRDTNKGLVSLRDADNNVVAAEIIMADDQIEPEKRNDIIVKPQAKLQAGTTYTVVVAAGLTAKNGTVLAEDIRVAFTTAATEEEGTGQLPRTSAHTTPAYLLAGLVLVTAGIVLRRKQAAS
ncbi:MAG TPA: Ig-like domain-containing protein [Firmicutes bacterium]|nr:Ig-like domain-containing protein [Bacillota bacterium]